MDDSLTSANPPPQAGTMPDLPSLRHATMGRIKSFLVNAAIEARKQYALLIAVLEQTNDEAISAITYVDVLATWVRDRVVTTYEELRDMLPEAFITPEVEGRATDLVTSTG